MSLFMGNGESIWQNLTETDQAEGFQHDYYEREGKAVSRRFWPSIPKKRRAHSAD